MGTDQLDPEHLRMQDEARVAYAEEAKEREKHEKALAFYNKLISCLEDHKYDLLKYFDWKCRFIISFDGKGFWLRRVLNTTKHLELREFQYDCNIEDKDLCKPVKTPFPQETSDKEEK